MLGIKVIVSKKRKKLELIIMKKNVSTRAKMTLRANLMPLKNILVQKCPFVHIRLLPSYNNMLLKCS